MLSKADALSMLADLDACERDLELIEEDPRSLEEIFLDPRARNKDGEILLYGDVYEDLNYSWKTDEYCYDIEWINDGPYGDRDKLWNEYTFEETCEMLIREHKLWQEDKGKWIEMGGGGYVDSNK